MQDSHDPHQLTLFREDRPGQRLDRQRAAGHRIRELDLPSIPLLARAGQHVRDERRQVCAVRAYAPQRRFVLHARRVEEPLGRRVHQDDVAFLIGHQDRIGDRIDDEIQPMPFVAHFRLSDPQRAVAFFDLFLRAGEICDVAENRDDVRSLALVLRARAEELEEQVRSFERIDEQQLAAGHLHRTDGARRERGGEQHVVERGRAPPSLARFIGRGEQLFSVAVRDHQLAFRVGEENRIRDRVDDAVKQHPLLAEARFGEQLTPEQTRDLLAQCPAEPQGFGVHRRSNAGDEQQTVRRLYRIGMERDRMKGARFERPALMDRQIVDIQRFGAVQGFDERMLDVVAVERKVHNGAARNAVLRDELHPVGRAFGDQNRRFGDWRVRDQPVERAPRRFLQVD